MIKLFSGFPRVNLSAARLVFGGNSITEQGYPSLVQSFYPNATIYNRGHSGEQTSQLIARASSEIDSVFSAIVPSVAILLEIGNDMYFGGTTRSAVDRYWAYCDGRRAAGFYVVACTTTPRHQVTNTSESIASFSARLNDANALVRSEYREHANLLCDFRLVPEFSQDTPDLRVFNSNDLIHPNLNGRQKMGEYLAFRLKSLRKK